MKGEIEYKKGLWTEEEDKILMDFIRVHGKGKWSRVAKMTVLRRCGKSCRLRWINYLSPSVKRGDFSEEEEDLIIRLHNLLGNRWSLIAGRVPGRTDNQVKNHWNTHLSKKLRFKKRECRANASSKSGEADQGNPSTLPGSSSEKPTEPADGIGGSDQSATQDGSREATRFNLSEQEVVIGTASYQTTCSFLPFVYEDMNMYTPQMMEYMDECALDYIWNGL